MARFQAGDTAAFDSIYDRFARPVYVEARRVVRDPHQAEDITQEVFGAVLRILPTFRGRDGGLHGWLFATTRNIAVTYMRRQGRTRVTAPSAMDGLVEAAASRDGPSEPTGVESNVWRLAQRLPALQRDVLNLRFRGDLSLREIAQRLNRSVGAIDQAQRRGLATLRIRMAPRRAPRAR